MFISKHKLYPKLKGFFHKSYLYSIEKCLEDRVIISDLDEKRYISALHYRFDYRVNNGIQQLSFYSHIQSSFSTCGTYCHIYYCVDIFSIKLLDRLKFVEIEISNCSDLQLLMDFYHNHFVHGVQRTFE
jgi:hypothetical protein